MNSVGLKCSKCNTTKKKKPRLGKEKCNELSYNQKIHSENKVLKMMSGKHHE
jgi:hypothetical protein